MCVTVCIAVYNALCAAVYVAVRGGEGAGAPVVTTRCSVVQCALHCVLQNPLQYVLQYALQHPRITHTYTDLIHELSGLRGTRGHNLLRLGRVGRQEAVVEEGAVVYVHVSCVA